MADVRARVHVDRGHGLSLIDDQVAARLQCHLPVQRFTDLLFDPVQIEYRSRSLVKLDARRSIRHERGGKRDHPCVFPRRIHEHSIHASR